MISQKQPLEVFYKKDVRKNFIKFTGKHQCHKSLFLTKVAGLRPATLFKERLWYRYLPVNFQVFLKLHFLQNTPGRVLLILKFLRSLTLLYRNTTKRLNFERNVFKP